MKIVLTGSLGNIGRPLTYELLAKGHEVTVISRRQERKSEIESLGATAAVGELYDVAFLADTFKGADIIYLMQPPGDDFSKEPDPRQSWTNIATGYVEAVQHAGIKKIVHLSSIGAHAATGVGMLSMHHRVENILKNLPDDVSIKFMRPVGFYYNMFEWVQTIKTTGSIIQNYGGDQKEPWVSPLDIAAAIAEEMGTPFKGRTIRYIASDEASPTEVAKILGNAIGMPELKWSVISDDQFFDALMAAGLNEDTAKGFTEMNASRMNGLYDDYYNHKPKVGKVKLDDFAQDFAEVYKRS